MLIGHTVSNAQGIIIAMDEGVCDLLHRSKMRLIGMSYLEITHPADRVHNSSDVARLQLNGTPALIRKRYLRPDGSFVPVDLEVSRLSAGIDTVRLVGTVRLPSPDTGISRPERLRSRAREAVEIAARRNAEFGIALAGDHAWIILLQLYLAEIECRIVSLHEICDLMGFPSAVTLHWIKALEAKGLVEDISDSSIHQLTATGFAAIERALDS
jgi:PAS domain-containing protein